MSLTAQKYTVLLLSAPLGSGHKMAAEALEEAFKKHDNVKVVNGSAFDFFPKWLGNIILGGYIGILKHVPKLYDIAYRWSNTGNDSLWLRDFLNLLLSYLAQGFIKKTAPDAVIVTHPTPAGVMTQYKRRCAPNLWVGAVITDFNFHHWWIYKGLDAYFTADADIDVPPELGIPAVATGIPIRAAFTAPFERDKWRERLGYGKNDTLCLVMGGGDGLLPMPELLRALTSHCDVEGLKIAAVTGHNTELAEKLKKMALPNVMVLDFIAELPQLLRSADIVISKAGGLTSAETLAIGTEFILYDPLPGQEVRNAEYLCRKCEANIAATPEEVCGFVKKYAGLDTKAKNDLRHRRREVYGKPFAADAVADFVLKTLDGLDSK